MNKPVILVTAALISLSELPSGDEARREPASFSLEPLQELLFRPDEPVLPKIDTNFEVTDGTEKSHA